MIRTPFDVIQSIVASRSSCEVGSAIQSEAPGAMAATASATAVPWISPPWSHAERLEVYVPTAV